MIFTLTTNFCMESRTEWSQILISLRPKCGRLLRGSVDCFAAIPAILPFCHSGHSAICRSIRYSTIPPFRQSAIPPFHHSAIPPFRHSTIPPFCHSAILLPLRHSAILPFRHTAIPPFRGRNPTKPRQGSMFCGKNLEIVSVRYRHHPRSSAARHSVILPFFSLIKSQYYEQNIIWLTS